MSWCSECFPAGPIERNCLGTETVWVPEVEHAMLMIEIAMSPRFSRREEMEDPCKERRLPACGWK